jgi:glycosyltransferase involved in cell wall biosynthesis
LQKRLRQSLKVCYFGTYRAEYSRNQIMIEGLRRAGLDVVECHASLWNTVEDRVHAASGGWRNLRFIWRVIETYMMLIRRYFKLDDFDVMVVGYPGQVDVYLAWLLTRLRRRPLVWDVFMSIYLIALERGLEHQSRFTVNMIRVIERWACHLPDCLILDTAEYVEWFQQIHHIRPERFRLVPTGADDQIFRPDKVERDIARPFTLVYYGTFIRNHGVPIIIEAANLLRDESDIQFTLIGEGPEKKGAVSLARHYGLTNIAFVDWLAREELSRYIAEADVCLGVFGTTPQSLMTVQNKIYEALAMQKPLVTGDSATVRSSFVAGKHLLLVSRTDPRELATAVKQLQRDPDQCARLADYGYQRYCELFTTQHLGNLMRAHLAELLARY